MVRIQQFHHHARVQSLVGELRSHAVRPKREKRMMFWRGMHLKMKRRLGKSSLVGQLEDLLETAAE